MIKGIASALFSIFTEGKYADKVVPQILKSNPQWGSRDRRFVAENCYEIVRYWRYYWYLLGRDPELTEEAIQELVGIRLLSLGYTLPDQVPFNQLHFTEPTLESIPEDVLFSFPDWLYKRASGALGNKWPNEAKALNEQASVYLRVNRSKIEPKNALNALLKANIPASIVDGQPDCIQLGGRANLEQLELIKNGLVEIQDAGSQLIAAYLDPKPGSFVIDACAGAGGKTLHIADLMADSGRIESLDTEGWKLSNLRFRANKSGFKSIQTHTLPNPEFFQKNAQKADYLLLDVPCSGTGVIRRNPDTKWKLTEERLEELKQIQSEILSSYVSLLKPGGKCVYATCSILPEENTEQVDAFIKANSEFTLIKYHTQFPSEGTDGFYMALLERK